MIDESHPHQVRSCVLIPLTVLACTTLLYSGITVKFSQDKYMFDESAGTVSLKVIIDSTSERRYPISLRYKVFVSDKFAPNQGLYGLCMYMYVKIVGDLANMPYWQTVNLVNKFYIQ